MRRNYNRYGSSSSTKEALLYGGAIIGVLGLSLGGCGKIVETINDPEDVVRSVEDQGFSNVEITDTDIFLISMRGCGEDDAVGYDISAVSNATGREVELKWCDGVFKGGTLRD